MRPLSDEERAVLSALTDDFVSATVIKVRSGLPRGQRNARVLEACMGLAQRGLAERAGSGSRSTLRWRRAKGYASMPTPQTRYRWDHLHLRSRDAVGAAAFYVSVLGAREIRRDGAPLISRVTLDLWGLTLFIEQAPDGIADAAQAPHLGIEHICLAVDDIEATYARLRRQNVAIVSGLTAVRPGLRVVFIEGPDGVRIELLQRTDIV